MKGLSMRRMSISIGMCDSNTRWFNVYNLQSISIEAHCITIWNRWQSVQSLYCISQCIIQSWSWLFTYHLNSCQAHLSCDCEGKVFEKTSTDQTKLQLLFLPSILSGAFDSLVARGAQRYVIVKFIESETSAMHFVHCIVSAICHIAILCWAPIWLYCTNDI